MIKHWGRPLYRHPLYATWYAMHQRCYNPNNPGYKHYGARGIKVCRRWHGIKGFENFVADMRRRPKGKSLDRIDNDGGYSPNNCHWATPWEQILNSRPQGKNDCLKPYIDALRGDNR